MAAPHAAGLVSAVNRLVLAHTGELDADELAAARALMTAAFEDFADEDWEHALGGMHALVVDAAGQQVLAHASLVMRRLLHGGRALRTGYVEAVATHPEHRRRGHGGAVMAALEGLAGAYDLLALGATDEAVAFYAGRGWQRWRGPTSVLTPDGVRATPEDDGAVHVRLPAGATLDLAAPLTCDWRAGDVW